MLRSALLPLGLAAFLLAMCDGSRDPNRGEPDGDGVYAGDGGGKYDGSARDAGADAGRPDDAGVADRVDGGASPADGGGTSASCDDVARATEDYAAYQALLACLRDGSAAAERKHAAVVAFVDAVDARGGFPIIAGAKVVFAHVGVTSGGALRVAGDFNNWSDSADTLQEEASGFRHLELPVAPAPGTAVAYKFVSASGASARWFADPMARRFSFDQNGEISWLSCRADRSRLERWMSVHATRLGNDRPVYVYLPAGYDAGAARYPVLYMHDGQNLFFRDAIWGGWKADAVADTEIGAGRARPFIIVGPANNADRMSEYTHVLDDIGDTVGGDSDKYADFLVHDLKPLVDARYRTLTDRANTGVIGSSLGGLVSFHIGLLHPDVFRFVGGMSSTFDWGRFGLDNPTMIELYDAVGDLAQRDQVFYLDSGGGPGNNGTCPVLRDSEGGDNYCATLAMKDVLERKGVDTYPLDPNATLIQPPDADIMHWWEPDAPHNEAAWNVRLFRVYRLFFRPSP